MNPAVPTTRPPPCLLAWQHPNSAAAWQLVSGAQRVTHFDDPVALFHTGSHGCASCKKEAWSAAPNHLAQTSLMYTRVPVTSLPSKTFSHVPVLSPSKAGCAPRSAPVTDHVSNVGCIGSHRLLYPHLARHQTPGARPAGQRRGPALREQVVCFICMCLDVLPGQIRVTSYRPVGRVYCIKRNPNVNHYWEGYG